MSAIENIGVVVIGRNEGDRLKRCINSILGQAQSVVYVDSGSTDGSAEWTKQQGVTLVQLDMSRPFTAARARNEGFAKLQEISPDLQYVQFVDGDCEISSNWLSRAIEFLKAQESVAVVCGRRREKFPHASVYNALCDIEWDTPIGEAKSCGGDSVIRASVFEQVRGFRPDVIAGEEPELCVRIRQVGWRVWRLDEEMTMHDAAMTKFSQWWKRTRRSGYAYALGASIHGFTAERFRVREVARILVWGAVLPSMIVLLALVSPVFLILATVYPIQFARLIMRSDLEGKIRLHWAFYNVVGKFPEFFGAASFLLNRLTSRQARIIEYK